MSETGEPTEQQAAPQRDDISTAARSLARIADRLPATGKPVVITLTKSADGWDIQVAEMTREWKVKR